MSQQELGCCGAYCRTCKPFRGGHCVGCKTGYTTGGRDLSRAKCRIKLCCIGKGLASCADCPDYASCPILQAFYSHSGYKYGKYRQATEFIRSYGYEPFFEIADRWTNACGKY